MSPGHARGESRPEVSADLDAFGFLVPASEGLPLRGCVYPSALFPGRAPDGRVLLHCMAGGPLDPHVLDDDDDA